MRRLYTSVLIVFLMVILTSPVYADSISKPHTFTAGTTAKASEVNANFDTVYNRVNQLNRLVVKDDGVEIGTLVSMGEFYMYMMFITSKGFIVTLRNDLPTGNVYLSEYGGVFFESSDCTGTPYLSSLVAKQVVKSPGGSVYYIPQGSALTPATTGSYGSPSNCSINNPPSISYAYELSPNSENITGVPDSGYGGPITIDIE